MLLKYLLKKWYLVIPYFVVVVATPIIHVNGVTITGTMTDAAVAGDYATFWRALMQFLGFFLLHGGLLLLVRVLRTRIISQCRKGLRQDMFEHLMTGDSTSFAQPDSGHHIATFSNDITILETQYFEAWLQMIEAWITIVTAITALINLQTSLAVIIIFCETLAVAICYAIRKYSRNKNRIYVEKLAIFTQRIKDYFGAFRMIQNYSVETPIRKRFEQMNEETEKAKNDADTALAFVNRMGNMCLPITKFMMVGVGIVLVMLGKMTMGSIFVAFQLSDQLVGPVDTTLHQINNIEAVRGITDRIKKMAKGSSKEKKQKDITLSEPATLKLDNVSMQLGGKQIIDGVSYTFEPGKKYLIIGRNGAGKSTLLKMLKRNFDEFNGQITINGNELRDFSYSSLSRVVSYINEAVPLLCDTVRQNILLYRDIPEEQLQTAVDAVGLTVDLDRVIRDGDRNLSSGETRRIEIARSLINRAGVIIYDEAISTLDIPTAYEIEKTLLSLRDQTLLFVSHNFSAQLIEEYDQILLLDQGKICGAGTHKELMQSSEYYRHIMKIKNG